MTLEPNGMRPVARSSEAMVTAPHALAAQAGVSIMKDGGNAADSAIAVAAALAALYPHMTGIGGDAFFLYYDAKSGQLDCYNGSGVAARMATLDFYRDRGLEAIPIRGGPAVLTAPGAVDAWFGLHERFGSLAMERILAPAIGYAERGAPAARSFVASNLALRDILAADEGAAVLFVSNGPAEPGQVFRNPRLASSLRSIASNGRSWFYEGPAARAIGDYCERVNSPLRASDMEAHRGFFTHAARGKYFGFESLTVPPNSQGIALLIAQRAFEALCAERELDIGTPSGVHAAVECIRMAFADRDAHVGDPGSSPSWHQLLTAEHARERASQVEPFAALPRAKVGVDRGDTAYFACVDGSGNAVSFIQSLFHSFGAGVVVPELGIALQNRGTAFELTQGGLRSLLPGRRPYHTLMPCLLLREGKPWLVYGTMGGEGQAQTTLQLSTRIAHQGADPQTAIEAPRWRWGANLPYEAPRLHVEARLGDACIAGLRARGHEVEVLGDWDESMGHAGAIAIDRERGVLSGGADPRGDGAALGF